MNRCIRRLNVSWLECGIQRYSLEMAVDAGPILLRAIAGSGLNQGIPGAGYQMEAVCPVWAYALHGTGCADVSRTDQPDARERNVALLGEITHDPLENRIQAL